MEGQGDTPEGGPDVVPVGVVGPLVGQYMAQDGLVLHSLRGEVDGGVKQSEQAGGGQAFHQVDGKRALQECPRVGGNGAALRQNAGCSRPETGASPLLLCPTG